MLLSLETLTSINSTQLISNDLTQMVAFPIRIPGCDSHSPALLGLFLSSEASVCSTMAFPPLRNSDHFLVSVSIDFPSNSQWNAPFHRIAYDYSHADWDGLRDHLRYVPWEDFKLGASAAASEFFECVQVGIDVYIPHRKYQVKPHLYPWFSAACAAAIVHRNHFFRLYQKHKSSDSKLKLREASNHCKRVLKAAKLAYANKKIVHSGEMLIVFSTKVNLLYLLYSTARRCCLLHLIKQNCLLKTSLRTLILMTHVSLCLFSFLELI